MTQDELLEALRAAMERPETADGLTTQDIITELGITDKRARQMLRDLSGQGLLEVVHVQRRNLAGIMHPRPAYRLKA